MNKITMPDVGNETPPGARAPGQGEGRQAITLDVTGRGAGASTEVLGARPIGVGADVHPTTRVTLQRPRPGTSESTAEAAADLADVNPATKAVNSTIETVTATDPKAAISPATTAVATSENPVNAATGAPGSGETEDTPNGAVVAHADVNDQVVSADAGSTKNPDTTADPEIDPAEAARLEGETAAKIQRAKQAQQMIDLAEGLDQQGIEELSKVMGGYFAAKTDPEKQAVLDRLSTIFPGDPGKQQQVTEMLQHTDPQVLLEAAAKSLLAESALTSAPASTDGTPDATKTADGGDIEPAPAPTLQEVKDAIAALAKENLTDEQREEAEKQAQELLNKYQQHFDWRKWVRGTIYVVGIPSLIFFSIVMLGVLIHGGGGKQGG